MVQQTSSDRINRKRSSSSRLRLEPLEDRNLLSYSVTDLGTLGGSSSIAMAINNSGQVVGNAATDRGEAHGFLWQPGNGMIDLGTLGGKTSFATGINNSKQVAGYAETASGAMHAFLWRPDPVMIDLGTLGGDSSQAYGINDSGHVVGVGIIPGGAHAFVWEASEGMTDLGTLGGSQSRARAINNAGYIVGSSSGPGFENHAFMVRPDGRIIDLGTLGGDYSGGAGLNESIQVAGQASTATDAFVTFRWQNGVMSNLGTLPGQKASYALGINEAGDVVGDSGYPDSHAFLYTNRRMIALENLVPPNSGWTFKKAQAINDRGQIVGFGINPGGETHGFLLTPNKPGPIPPSFFVSAGLATGLTWSNVPAHSCVMTPIRPQVRDTATMEITALSSARPYESAGASDAQRSQFPRDAVADPLAELRIDFAVNVIQA